MNELENKINYVCSHCNSENIVWDAWAKWNEYSQEFNLENTFEFCFCKDCDGETTPKKVELKTLGVMKVEENELIAEFMGVVFHDDKNQYYDSGGLYIGLYLKYDTSWDWLMPVVEKINEIVEEDDNVLDYFRNIDYSSDLFLSGGKICVSHEIDNVYQDVVKFVKWYNKQVEIDADMASDFDREPDFNENKQNE